MKDMHTKAAEMLSKMSFDDLDTLERKMSAHLNARNKVNCLKCQKLHHGKKPTCQDCSKKVCKQCSKQFSRTGTGSTCGLCMKKRSR